ncbi:MAG: hypothetical protein V3T54_07085, partial [Acidobacteriota bacterium]
MSPVSTEIGIVSPVFSASKICSISLPEITIVSGVSVLDMRSSPSMRSIQSGNFEIRVRSLIATLTVMGMFLTSAALAVNGSVEVEVEAESLLGDKLTLEVSG